MQIYENVRPPSCQGGQGNSGFIPIAQSDITGDLAFRFFYRLEKGDDLNDSSCSRRFTERY